ncbi:MAG TPA: glycosyltransferase [Sunxiuqinia sp.]|nr:glycosyltransferase [Sunxiuqinia sp.]
MKVLMFGWEFPPNISGGLGTACYGITKSLADFPDVGITFVIPKAQGNETKNKIKLIGANQIDLIKSKIRKERLTLPVECYSVESQIVPYVSPASFEKRSQYQSNRSIPESSPEQLPQNMAFSGGYGRNLLDEIQNFSVISEYISTQTDFDVIHAHDWLTFPAGIAAKKLSGKPLVIHIHATDFDRSGGKINPRVFNIEKEGMDLADKIVCVSNRTRQMVIDNYHIDPEKTTTVYNGVEFSNSQKLTLPLQKNSDKIVTFLGRITLQKGPGYFIQVAKLVLSRMKNVRFIMAGNGDLYGDIIRKVAAEKIGDRFLFTGFLEGDDVCRMLKLSDVFVMPSVSEPFGICPLEAMQSGVPAIISKQSGVSEIVKHAIKVDFWDVHAMADAIHALLTYPAMNHMMTTNAMNESREIKWEHTAQQLRRIYLEMIRA